MSVRATMPAPAGSRWSLAVPAISVVAYLSWLVANSPGSLPGLLGGLAAAGCALAVVTGFVAWATRPWPLAPGATVRAVAWGGGGSLIAAGAFVAALRISDSEGADADRLIAVLAGPLEETIKGAFVVGLLLVAPAVLTRPGHAIACAALSGAGFGAVEVVGDLIVRSSTAAPWDVITTIQKAVLIHPGITAFIGAGVALALTRTDPLTRLVAVGGGWIVAVALHLMWDTSVHFTTVAPLRPIMFLVLYAALLTGAVALLRQRRHATAAARQQRRRRPVAPTTHPGPPAGPAVR